MSPISTLKDAENEEKDQIAAEHVQLRHDFELRDHVRNPEGWHLPVDEDV